MDVKALLDTAEKNGAHVEMQAGFVTVALDGVQGADVRDKLLRRLGARVSEIRTLLEKQAPADIAKHIGKPAFIYDPLYAAGKIAGDDGSGDHKKSIFAEFRPTGRYLNVLCDSADLFIIEDGPKAKGFAWPLDVSPDIHQALRSEGVSARREAELLIFTWPGSDEIDVPSVLWQVMRELANFAESENGMAGVGYSIPPRFVDLVSTGKGYAAPHLNEHPLELSRIPECHRRIAALFLIVASQHEDLRRKLRDENRDDLEISQFIGLHAFAPNVGERVFLESQNGVGFVCRDDLGERYTLTNESLLILLSSSGEGSADGECEPAPARKSPLSRFLGAS